MTAALYLLAVVGLFALGVLVSNLVDRRKDRLALEQLQRVEQRHLRLVDPLYDQAKEAS